MQFIVVSGLALGVWGNWAAGVAVYDSLGPGDAFASYGVSVGEVLGYDWEAGIRFTPGQTVRFGGVDVALAETLSGNGAGLAAVTLRLDAGGAPGAVVETMVTPTVDALSGDVWSLATGFGPTLAAGRAYWITVGRAPGSALGGTWRYAAQNDAQPVTVATRKDGGAWVTASQPRPYGVRVAGAAVMPGDANQDGRITTDDFALIDRGMARHLAGWTNGDFNGDNVVNSQDYLILDQAYLAQTGAGPSPAMLAEREQEFGADYASQLAAMAPEPGGVTAVVVGALVAGWRRARR
jgi:hypothetical protein